MAEGTPGDEVQRGQLMPASLLLQRGATSCLSDPQMDDRSGVQGIFC